MHDLHIVTDQHHAIELCPNDMTSEVYYGYATEKLSEAHHKPVDGLGKLIHLFKSTV